MMIKESTQFKLRSSLRQFAGIHEEIITNLNYNLLSIIVFQPTSHKKLPTLTSSSSKENFSIYNATYTPIVCNRFLNWLPLSGRYLKHLMAYSLLTAVFRCTHCFMHWLIHSLLFSEYGNSESSVFSLLLFQEKEKLSPVGQSSFVGTRNAPSVVRGNFLRNLGFLSPVFCHSI